MKKCNHDCDQANFLVVQIFHNHLSMYIYIFMARSRVSKSCLKAELCFHHYVYFACVPIYVFSFHHKQCSSDWKDFTFVKFTTQSLVLMNP